MTKKLLVAALLLGLAAAAPLAAQQGPPPGGPGAGPGGPGGPPPEVVLREVLGFTDAQVSSLHQLADTRRAAVEALQPQIVAAEKAFRDLVEAASPDPTAVGTAFLSLQALQRQMPAVDEAYRSGFRALLTPEQTAKVDAFRGVETALRTLEALHRLGL